MFKNVHQSETPDKCFIFEIHNVDISIVNGIRRVILTDIPVVGFRGEENPSIEMIVNNGPLHNEFMLHRIGLIPIHLTNEETETFDSAHYDFEVDVSNTSQNRMNVTTEDFKVTKNGTVAKPSKYFPPDEYTKEYALITRLRPGERLHFKAKAVKSTAREHASFSPVSLCAFSYMVDPSSSAQGILEKERDFYKNEYGEATQVLFKLETVAALTPQYLVDKALSILIDKIDKFMESEAFNEPVRVDNGMEFHINGEDDTLGYLLQSLMHNHYIRAKNETTNNKPVTYVGYYSPHPLETSVVVKVTIKDHDQVEDDEYIDVMRDSCYRIKAEIERVKAEWENIKLI